MVILHTPSSSQKCLHTAEVLFFSDQLKNLSHLFFPPLSSPPFARHLADTKTVDRCASQLYTAGAAVVRTLSGRFNEVTQTHKANKCNNAECHRWIHYLAALMWSEKYL